MKDVELEYVEINNKSCIFFKMAAKMAAENSNPCNLNSALRYKDECSEMKVVEFKYEEINKKIA